MSRKPGKGNRKLAAIALADEDDLLLGRKAPVDAAEELETAQPSLEVAAPPAGLALRKKPSRKKDSFYLTTGLSGRLRNATGWFQEQDYSVTKGDIVEAALSAYLNALEAEHLGGKPFPKLRRALKQGVV
jgi:hypothetical protein